MGFLLLGALAAGAFSAAVYSIAGVGEQVRRASAHVGLAQVPVALNQGAAHAQPDAADYGTIRGERDGLGKLAKSLLAKIGRCEHSVADPYGGGLSTLNGCLSVSMHVNIERARFEPLLLTPALRNMRGGACGRLTAALLSGVLELGDASDAWTGDVGLPGKSQGRREQADVHTLRQIANGLVRLGALRSWRLACRSRPYDAVEHGGPARPRRTRLVTHLVF